MNQFFLSSTNNQKNKYFFTVCVKKKRGIYFTTSSTLSSTHHGENIPGTLSDLSVSDVSVWKSGPSAGARFTVLMYFTQPSMIHIAAGNPCQLPHLYWPDAEDQSKHYIHAVKLHPDMPK